MKRTQLLDTAKILVLALVLGLGVSTLSAATWTAPTMSPPNGNVDAPINVGSAAQRKIGPFYLGSSFDPTAQPPVAPILDVLGIASTSALSTDYLLVGKAFSLAAGCTDGSCAGKVLTADASGIGSWQAVTGGSGSTGGGSGDSLIKVATAYRKASVSSSVTIPIPTGASYGILTMYGNDALTTTAADASEDHEVMDVYLDFSNNTSTGMHAQTLGVVDSVDTNYIWDTQPFGTNVAVTSGDNTADYGVAHYGMVIAPNFSKSGSNLVISHLPTAPTQETFVVKFYSKNGTTSTTGGASWIDVPVTDTTTPFDQACEYRIRVTTNGDYSSWAGADPVLYINGVDPEQLVYISHSGHVSHVPKIEKNKYYADSTYWYAVRKIEKRCGGTSTGTTGSGMLGSVPDAILCKSGNSQIILYSESQNNVSWTDPGRLVYASFTDIGGGHQKMYFDPTTGAYIGTDNTSSAFSSAIAACTAKGNLSNQTGFKFAGVNTVSGGSATSAVYFGGMYGTDTGGSYTNPMASNTRGCPTGYTASQIEGHDGIDYGVWICLASAASGVQKVARFGGAYSDSNGYKNPYTNAQSCPSGFTAKQVLGRYGVDYNFFYCYSTDVTTADVKPFGGIFGSGAYGSNSAYTNPVTGGGCTLPFVPVAVYGTPYVDYEIDVCSSDVASTGGSSSWSSASTPDYESDWITVGASASGSVTHNLGVSRFSKFQVIVRQDATHNDEITSDSMEVGKAAFVGAASYNMGITFFVSQSSSPTTQVKYVTGYTAPFYVSGSSSYNGLNWNVTSSGYITSAQMKVRIWK